MNGVRPSRVLIVACALNFVLAIAVHWLVLRDFANSGDEYAYLLSATLFSEGRLSVPSPEPRAAFDLSHVVNDGRYYGKYTPGWPALLAAGVWAGVPWIINPILSLVTLVLLHRLAAREVSGRAADVLALCLAGNPFAVFMAASYFPHPACLLFLTIFLTAAIDARRRLDRARPFVLMGLAAGASLLVREFTTLAFTLPVVGWLTWSSVHERRLRSLMRGLSLGALAFAPCAGALLGYNAMQTGSPFLPPLVRYGDPGFADYTIWWGLRVNLLERLVRLSIWLPLSIPLAVLSLAASSAATRGRLVPFAMPAAAVIAAFVLYLTSAGNEYGPRYVYETTGALTILMAAAITRIKTWPRLVLGAVVLMNAGGLAWRCAEFAPMVRERMTLYDLVAARNLTGAIVVLQTGSGSMRPGDLARNGTRFDAPVLFIQDRGAANRDVFARYPGRTAWIFQYDSFTGSGTLSRYADGSAAAASLARRR